MTNKDVVNMTIKIACEDSPYKALKEAEEAEKEGFIPISITGVPRITSDRNLPGTCILMYKSNRS